MIFFLVQKYCSNLCYFWFLATIIKETLDDDSFISFEIKPAIFSPSLRPRHPLLGYYSMINQI